jgi:predicted nucleic acid-binding protein
MIALPVACVVDASVGIKLVVTETGSAEAHALFAYLARDPAARFHIPNLFEVECANILWKQILRFGYPLADAKLNLQTLLALGFQRVSVTALVAEALPIAATHGVTAYDACYVVLAHRLGISLVTADAHLAAKMAGSGYAIVELFGLTIPPAP